MCGLWSLFLSVQIINLTMFSVDGRFPNSINIGVNANTLAYGKISEWGIFAVFGYSSFSHTQNFSIEYFANAFMFFIFNS